MLSQNVFFPNPLSVPTSFPSSFLEYREIVIPGKAEHAKGLNVRGRRPPIGCGQSSEGHAVLSKSKRININVDLFSLSLLFIDGGLPFFIR